MLTIFMVSAWLSAIPITYDVDRQVGAGYVFGTITTDGTQGALETANIFEWNLLLTATTTSILLTETNSEVSINPNADPAVFAATEALWFDYTDGAQRQT